MGDPQATNLPEMAAAAIASGDAAAMQATIDQLVGAFAGLQNDVQHLLQQRTNEPSNPTPPLNAMPTVVSSLTDGDSKLKLPTPKSYDGSQTPGAVENFLFDCEQYFVSVTIGVLTTGPRLQNACNDTFLQPNYYTYSNSDHGST
jgi:hypothetical protein